MAGVLLGVSSYGWEGLHLSPRLWVRGKISQGQGQGCLSLTSTGCPKSFVPGHVEVHVVSKATLSCTCVYVETVLSIDLAPGMHEQGDG